MKEDDIALFLSRDSIIEPIMSVAYDTSYRIKGEPTIDDPYLRLLTEFRDRVHDDILGVFLMD